MKTAGGLLVFAGEVALAAFSFRYGLLKAFTVKDPTMVTWLAILLAYLFVVVCNLHHKELDRIHD